MVTYVISVLIRLTAKKQPETTRKKYIGKGGQGRSYGIIVSRRKVETENIILDLCKIHRLQLRKRNNGQIPGTTRRRQESTSGTQSR